MVWTISPPLSLSLSLSARVLCTLCDAHVQVSFYALPSSVLGNDKHSLLREAYCWYLFADTTTLTDLLNDALILAKRLEFDVFNALEIGENDRFLQAQLATLQPAISPFACNLPCSPRLQTQPTFKQNLHLQDSHPEP